MQKSTIFGPPTITTKATEYIGAYGLLVHMVFARLERKQQAQGAERPQGTERPMDDCWFLKDLAKNNMHQQSICTSASAFLQTSASAWVVLVRNHPKMHEMVSDRSSRAENCTDIHKISMRVFFNSKKCGQMTIWSKQM